MTTFSKVFVVVLDGAADRPIASLGSLTPYSFAKTPNLDAFARKGMQGLVTIIDPTIPPESDSGIMALLSYDPLALYAGRGSLEGLGSGFVSLDENYVSFRINIASYDPATGFLDRRTARDLAEDELQELGSEIRDGLDFSAYPDIECRLDVFRRHRGILTFKSASRPLSGNVTNTDPGFTRVGPFGVPVNPFVPRPLTCAPLDGSDTAVVVARLVNDFIGQSAAILARSRVNQLRKQRGKLAANFVLVRDGGGRPSALTTFCSKFGRSLSIYGQMPSENGLAQLVGGRFFYSLDRDLSSPDYHKRAAEEMLEDSADVVLAHLKGPDEPGHDNDPIGKARAIADLDEYFFGSIMDRFDAQDYLIVTSDHATPCELGIHAADPVPTLVVGPNIQGDTCMRVSESEAVQGKLPVTRAIDLLPFVFERIGKGGTQ